MDQIGVIRVQQRRRIRDQHDRLRPFQLQMQIQILYLSDGRKQASGIRFQALRSGGDLICSRA